MNTCPAALLCCAILGVIPAASAQDVPATAPTTDRAAISLQAAAEQPPARDAVGARHRFLEKDAWTMTFGASVADDMGDMSEAQVYGSYGTFLEARVEFIAEASVRYFNQLGNNAVGFNPAIVFRYHFWKSDEDATWTAYADVGIGVLITTDDVPDTGTSFNFTPRAGIGFTRALTDNARLEVGLRWSHISNARLWGDDDNPASDAPMLYAGVSWVY